MRGGMLPGGPGAMDLAAGYMGGINTSMLGQMPAQAGASHLLNGPMVRYLMSPQLTMPTALTALDPAQVVELSRPADAHASRIVV